MWFISDVELMWIKAEYEKVAPPTVNTHTCTFPVTRADISFLAFFSFIIIYSFICWEWWSPCSCKYFFILQTPKISNNSLQQWRGYRITWDLREERCCLLLSQCGFLLRYPPMKITTSCWVLLKRPVPVKFDRLSKGSLSQCIRIKTQWVASLLRAIETRVCHLLLWYWHTVSLWL